MGRRATGGNLLSFSVATLSQRSYRRKLEDWAKCLHIPMCVKAWEFRPKSIFSCKIFIISTIYARFRVEV